MVHSPKVGYLVFWHQCLMLQKKKAHGSADKHPLTWCAAASHFPFVSSVLISHFCFWQRWSLMPRPDWRIWVIARPLNSWTRGLPCAAATGHKPFTTTLSAQPTPLLAWPFLKLSLWLVWVDGEHVSQPEMTHWELGARSILASIDSFIFSLMEEVELFST